MNSPAPTTWTSRQLDFVYRAVAALLGLWLLLWLLLPWTSLHDAALGYMRASQDLDANRSLWRSGVDWGLGRWSFLYVVALMLLRPLLNSIYLLRVLSSIGFIVLVLRLGIGLSERVRRGGRITLTVSLLLLAVLVTPATIYWLNDGTEAVWTLLAVVGLVYAMRRVARHGTSSSWPLAMWSCFCVALRSEMIFAVLASSLMLAVWNTPAEVAAKSKQRRRVVGTPWKTPLTGGLCGLAVLLCVRLLIQAGLPMHIVFHPMWWIAALVSAWHSFLKCGSFAWGLALLWLFSWAVVTPVTSRSQPTRVANLLPFGLLLLLCVRGQQVAFPPEMAWPLLYAILWNILEIAAAERNHLFAPVPLRNRLRLGMAAALLLLVAVPFEGYTYVLSIHERYKFLTRFTSQPLGLLGGLRAVSDDPGYFSYYTQSPVCNPGRPMDGDVYPLDYGDRLQGCALGHPEYALLTLPQAEDLAMHMDLSDWVICQSYGLPDLTRHNQHFLVASPKVAEHVCVASRGVAVPLASIIPAYAGKDIQ